MNKKEKLTLIINDSNANPIVVEEAQKELDKLISSESASESGSISDADVQETINKVSEALAQAVRQFDESDQEIKDLISSELATTKFGVKNLSQSVVDLIGRTQSVNLINPQNQTTYKSSTELRPLARIILSDFEAGNNVYLYGGAGTGKTFIANQIAKYLRYRLVTLNCNQFTGELQIIGGQTIEGYQEGRLTTAFGNIDLGFYLDDEGKQKPYKGALLLLDELPKIDPNSAGILNDGLSKIKDPSNYIGENSDGGEIFSKPTIENGRGELIKKANIFVIATGNSKLNEADKDYEANFKQDLSLQDRFAGSTYEIKVNPEYELSQIMTNFKIRIKNEDIIADFTFIFNFLLKLRMAITSKDRYDSRAFVSTRLMVSFRDTYIAYRVNALQANPIKEPKTLKLATQSFLSLFTNEQRKVLEEELKIEEFYAIIEKKNKDKIEDLSNDLDKAEAQSLIELFDKANPDAL